MKKRYIPPKSNIFILKLEENIASSGGDSTGGGGDELAGMMVILFSHDISPCRTYYTGSQTAVNTVGPTGDFLQYFMDMQTQGAPIGCLKAN